MLLRGCGSKTIMKNNKDKLLIIGASGQGKVVADIAIKMDKWRDVAFLDDNQNIKSSMGLNVIGKAINALKYIDNYDIFIAIGHNAIRKNFQQRLEENGASIPVLIHPSSIIGYGVNIKPGTVVMAGSVINCCSEIGNGCIINTGVTIDHDSVIDDYVHLSPGVHLAGAVKVGKESWLGIGSAVINNITVSENCIIGAGAIVINNLIEPGTYVGIPARILSKRG
jgi:sugar O-acyltransferase (sialic acid O-acetyltransferase NeuD family)